MLGSSVSCCHSLDLQDYNTLQYTVRKPLRYIGCSIHIQFLIKKCDDFHLISDLQVIVLSAWWCNGRSCPQWGDLTQTFQAAFPSWTEVCSYLISRLDRSDRSFVNAFLFLLFPSSVSVWVNECVCVSGVFWQRVYDLEGFLSDRETVMWRTLLDRSTSTKNTFYVIPQTQTLIIKRLQEVHLRSGDSGQLIHVFLSNLFKQHGIRQSELMFIFEAHWVDWGTRQRPVTSLGKS